MASPADAWTPQSAAGLIAGSALGAFQPHHSTPTTTT